MCIPGKSLYSFFTYNCRGGILPNIAFRLYRFREYKIILMQLFYIPFCIVIMSRGFYLEFVVLKLLLFILPLLRNLYINYICWHKNPELQVDLETVLLSPFFNFFLIMCAVHGRLKCILWYLPNVPANHGMLQRCCPRSYTSVSCDDVKYEEVDVKSKVITEFHNTENENGSTTFNPLIESDHKDTLKERSKPSNVKKLKSTAELLLQTRSDVYELFERDGSSSIVVYRDEEVDPYFPPV